MRRLTAILVTLVTGGGALAVVAGAPAAAAPSGPSRATAAGYAARTYVREGSGRRVFALSGPQVSVVAGDGSRITAFPILLADSGDGTGQAVLLFRNSRFLGWASAYDALHLSVGRRGSAIAVRYGVYKGNDPFCCASSFKTVRYRWNGARIVADGQPPLTYGRKLDRLHLAG